MTNSRNKKDQHKEISSMAMQVYGPAKIHCVPLITLIDIFMRNGNNISDTKCLIWLCSQCKMMCFKTERLICMALKVSNKKCYLIKFP